jgi:hypothetical protein
MTAVKTTNVKVVRFPAGRLRLYGGHRDSHVQWGLEYEMIVFPGRGPVYFAEGDIAEGDYRDVSETFNKAALRRCIKVALTLSPGEAILEERSQIRVRRFLGSKIFEVRLPCREDACLKQATMVRLLRELT